MINKELIDIIKKTLPNDLAKELNSVQPMDKSVEALKKIYESASSEKDLIKEGYEPVCECTRLMWIKKRK